MSPTDMPTSAPVSNPDPLLDVEGAARYLGLSRTTIWREVARGNLRKTTLGRVVRFRVSHLESYLHACTSGGDS